MIGIYKITSPTKKVYIGQSSNIEKRFYAYKKLYCKTQTYLYNSFLKYGIEKHSFEIIHICDKEELNVLEKYYVDLFQTFKSQNGLNIKDGGGCKGAMSDETKKKISKANKNPSDEIKCKRRDAAYKRWSPENRLKNQHGYKEVSAETRLKISQALIGRKKSKYTARVKCDTNKKIILNLENGIYYLGVAEAAETYKLNTRSLQNMLNGINKNKSVFIYA